MGTTHFVASTGNDFPTESLKDWVARVPRKVVLHRMETAECLEDRVFWAIILWSWCGPQVSDAVVIKDRRGYIQKDAAGKPVPAKLGDLLSLLGLAPGMKGHISRAIQRLKAKDSVRYEGRVLYPVKEPNPPENPPIVASTGNVFIAGIVINIDDIVASTGNGEVARPEIVQLLNDLSTEWKTGLKHLKTEIKALLVQRLSAHGILISLEEKKRRREEDPPDGPVCLSSVPVQEDRQTDTRKPRDAELEAMVVLLKQRIRSQDPVGDSLIPGIRANLKGAPLQRFWDWAVQRMKKGDSLGKLLNVAADVGTMWLEEQRESQAKAREEEARLIEAWRSILNDPDESEEAKAKSREFLRARRLQL